MKLRYKLLSVFLVLVGVFLYGRCSKPKAKLSTVIPSNDTEQIIIDPIHHTIITTDAHNHQTVTTLPDRQSVIDIHKDGSVQVTSAQWGKELRPFGGLAFSDAARLSIGADVFYWKKLDLGLGVQTQFNVNNIRMNIQISYNVYSNLHAGLTYDNHKTLGGVLYVRF